MATELTDDALEELLPDDAVVDGSGRLRVGGCDVAELAAAEGTPLYVYAEHDLRSRARAFASAAGQAPLAAAVHFAIKALPCRGALKLTTEEGLGWEAGSSGELRLALDAGLDPARGVFTGGDKEDEALELGLRAGLGLLALDSESEARRAAAIAASLGRRQDVLLSLTPTARVAGIRHDPVTGQLDRRAGLHLATGEADRVADLLRRLDTLRVVGVHMHLGARLYDAMPGAITEAARFVADRDLPCEIFDAGGGPNAPTARGDRQPTIAEHVAARAASVRSAMAAAGQPLPRLLLEPGQAVVGPAGLTVYRVVGVRRGVRTYVTVDGGLHENPRPLLYGTKHEALLAQRSNRPPETVSIAGVSAEAGDVLAWDVELAVPAIGDVLVIPATGAYGHALASNWGRFPRPPIVFCADGRATTVVRRETFTDILARDVG